MPRARLSLDALPAELFRHLERCAPEEGCGLLFEGPERLRFEPLENAQRALHLRDRSAPSPRAAFRFDPAEHLAALIKAERRGELPVAIVHSHVDAPAVLSAEDRAQAAPERMPLFPGLGSLVVAVVAGKAAEARLFFWEEGDFREVACLCPPM